MGGRDGDHIDFELQGPNRSFFVSQVQTIQGNKAVWVGGVGKRRTSDSWVAGRYNGKVSLIRSGKVLLEEKIILELP